MAIVNGSASLAGAGALAAVGIAPPLRATQVVESVLESYSNATNLRSTQVIESVLESYSNATNLRTTQVVMSALYSMPNISQVIHRHRTDAGLVDDSPAWAASENQLAFAGFGVPHRLRFSLSGAGGGGIISAGVQLMVSVNKGAYQPVSPTSKYVQGVDIGANNPGDPLLIPRLTFESGAPYAAFIQPNPVDGSNLPGYSIRNTIPLSGAGGNTLLVRVKAHSTNTLFLDHVGVGIQSTTYNTVATPVEVTFYSGQSGITKGLPAGTSLISDPVNLTTTGVGQTIVVILDMTAGGTKQITQVPSIGNAYILAATASYNQASPAGSWSNNASLAFGVYEIDLWTQ